MVSDGLDSERWGRKIGLPSWGTTNGNQTFDNLTVNGNLSVAGTSTFTGAITGSAATFSGAVSTGALTSTTGTFSGAVSATNGTFSGNISAVNGAFSGTLSATGLFTATAGWKVPDDTDGVFGTDNDIRVRYDETTDNRLEWHDGTNLLAYLTDAGTTGNWGVTGSLLGNTIAVHSGTTATVYNATETTVNAFGAGTAITLGATTGTCTIRNATVAITGATALTVTPPTTITGDLTLAGGDIIASTATTWNVLNTVATTVNAFGAATTINVGTSGTSFQVGSTSGSSQTNVQITSAAGQNRCFRFLTGSSRRWEFRCDSTSESGSNAGSAFGIVAYDDSNVFIDIPFQIGRASTGSITIARPLVGAATQALLNTTSTTINFGGAATAINMGAGASTTITLSATTAIAANTGAITTNQTTIAVFNTTATTVNAFGAASVALNIGNASATATFAGGITIADAKNIVLNTTTGTQIGTATGQKLAFHGSTPVSQRAGAAQAAVATTGSTNVTPFGYTTSAQADAIVTLLNEIRATLVEKGIMKGSA